MDFYQYFSIGLYFALMLGIGWYAYKKSTSNLDEYLLGGRKLGAAVTALSAGASDMSGWLLMGLPGAMFVSGISSIWIAVGLTIGAYCNYMFVAPRLRTYTETANDSITIPDFFENRFQDKSKLLRLFSALIILVFFTLYTSSGMVAGGTLFKSAFGLDYLTGMLVTAFVVIAYTLFGGFLAVSLTDFVQGVIMVTALILIPIVAISEVGGMRHVFERIEQVNPDFLKLFQGSTTIGMVSLMAWGLGYFGQPHILVRFMAISSIKELKSARRIGIWWMILSVLGAMFIGLVGIAYVADKNIQLDNPETIFIYFSRVLFHPLITGFLLSAILAAVMSTISSQLLVTSSAMTEDFYKAFISRKASDKELVMVGRISVFIVAIVAILLSITPNDNILNLVGHAWAGFGSAFGPVILLSLYWKRMNAKGAFAGMFVGALVVLLWVFTPFTIDGVYAMIPGFISALIAIVAVTVMTEEPSAEVQKSFETMEQALIDNG